MGNAIDHIRTIKKDDLVDVDLFDLEILTQAKKMAEFYVLYYALENSVRNLNLQKIFLLYCLSFFISHRGDTLWELSYNDRKVRDRPAQYT